MEYRDWLIRQQQQDHIRQRFEALFTKDEDHAAAATQGIEDLATTQRKRRLRPTTTLRSL